MQVRESVCHTATLLRAFILAHAIDAHVICDRVTVVVYMKYVFVHSGRTSCPNIPVSLKQW